MIIDAHHHFWDPARADYPFLEKVPRLCRRFGPDDLPRLRVILDHVGRPPFGTPSMADWRDGIVRLAQLPNAFCKLSGVLAETDDLAAAALAIREAVAYFGADRCLFGSDWPVCLLAAGYAESLDLVTSALAADVVPTVLAETAAYAYRLALV